MITVYNTLVEAYIQGQVIKKTLVSVIQSSRQIIAADKRESEKALDVAARRCYAEEGRREGTASAAC